MYVLIVYDVSTANAAGERRLAKVARLCVRYGQRVQNSVFECSITPAQYAEIKHELEKICDQSQDTVRLYNLGKNWENRVEHIGTRVPYHPDEPFIR